MKQANAATLLTKSPWWAQAVSLAHAQAYTDIVQTLLGRGFTIAQVLAWDAGPVYERTIALFYALADNEVLSEKKGEILQKGKQYLDSLKTVVLPVATLVADPLGPVGLPNFGPMATGQDLFVLTDPDDPRRGEPTRF